MQKFRIVASKSNKKYNLILTAPSESEARERIHKEGYSILSIKIAEEREIEGKKFIFHIFTEKGLKKGIIVGDDIYKAYVKLVDELGYNVLYLYPEEDEGVIDEDTKKKIMSDLQKGHNIKNEKKKTTEKKEKLTGNTGVDDSFYMKKELEETHKLIDKVLQKLDPIVNETAEYTVPTDKLEKLRNIYTNIIKLKKSTNISKLKEIGELALLKIGKIELDALEDEKTQESKALLKETNNLLRKIGSNKQFREKNKDIAYILSSFSRGIQRRINYVKNIRKNLKEKKEKKLIDKDSYSFLKTVLLLEKYNEKLSQNNKEIIKNLLAILIPFGKNAEISEKIFTKRRVIKQNISLLKAKKAGGVQSYTAIVKGYHKTIENFFIILHEVSHFFFYVVFFYAFFFATYLICIRLGINFGDFTFNYKGLYYFIGILLITILGTISRGLVVFFLNFVFFVFLLIFSLVNF